jgi:hypothetical protein
MSTGCSLLATRSPLYFAVDTIPVEPSAFPHLAHHELITELLEDHFVLRGIDRGRVARGVRHRNTLRGPLTR